MPGEPEHRCVGRPEQNRDGHQHHRPPHHVGEPSRVVALNHAEDGFLDERPRERRLGPIRPRDNRHRHQRHGGDPRVDQRDRNPPDRQHPPQVAGLEVEVGGEVACRLDSRIGDRRNDQRIDDVLDARRAEQVELVGEKLRVEDDDQAHDDHQELQAELREREQDQPRLPGAPGHPDDVERGREADHGGRDANLHAALGELTGDRRQVVRERDRRGGDHDQVVDQDRPAGDEADQLVERPSRERRGPPRSRSIALPST